MKKAIILTVCLSFLSCNTYIDINRYSHHTERYKFHFYHDFNEYIYYSKIYGKAGDKLYYPYHFNIKLPKKIANWGSSDTNFFFEYNSKQIIYIKSDYQNPGIEDKWVISDYYGDISREYSFIWYWKERGYNIRYLQGEQENRINKLYSNGKIDIILYNIKPENVEKYLTLIKSFKIVDYDKREE
ncbi:hypothetical protein [Flavobacterium litorale]|uniref:Lipoprotein n=1 Tax=Flavobacterium litorale TaxID=2856519 RepID=A0ABX8V5X4_9FLAO|nr:hypothetical protein [Flavobacterium litorale]QYJ68238.1 hypothetical protein K1I41_12030 [Flavobacterium litorale]